MGSVDMSSTSQLKEASPIIELDAEGAEDILKHLESVEDKMNSELFALNSQITEKETTWKDIKRGQKRIKG